MKQAIFAFGIIAAAATAHAATYEIDPYHSNARFEIDHFNTSSNVGGVYEIKGEVEFDAKRKTGSANIVLPVANLQASSKAFTEHLQSADLFNVAQYPEIRFVGKKFNFSGNKVKSVTGDLTLLGKTRPVTLTATKFGCYNNPMKNNVEVCGGDFKATIDRTLWGMNYLVDAGMTKKVNIYVQIEATKK
ncbi:MAG: YceI family protein [Neisseria sp.]|nr:YceI family protein [Neisseria sp.]